MTPALDSGPEWIGLCLWQEGNLGGMEKAVKAGPGIGGGGEGTVRLSPAHITRLSSGEALLPARSESQIHSYELMSQFKCRNMRRGAR